MITTCPKCKKDIVKPNDVIITYKIDGHYIYLCEQCWQQFSIIKKTIDNKHDENLKIAYCDFMQPERSKREDLPLEDDGRIKILCQRRNCGATLLIRAYSKDKGTHFCPACWTQLYCMRDFILGEAERHKKTCPSIWELDKILINDLIQYGEMRCSELVRQVREG